MDPEQYEAKLILSEVPFGSHTRIAEGLGITVGAVSRRFNLNDELKSGIGEAKRELEQLRIHAPKQYEQALTFLGLSVEPVATADTGMLVGNVAKQTADIVCAEVQRKPHAKKMKELREAEVAVSAYGNHLRQQIKLRKAS